MAFFDKSAAKTQCSTPEAPDRSWSVDSPVRLEIFLRQFLPDASRESLRRALAAGLVTVDGRPRHLGFRLSPGALVTLSGTARLTAVAPETIPLEILYEDDDLIAVNKPAGLLVHPTARERTGTVANALRGLGHSDIHFLHRLDRETSGVLLAAKSLPRHSPLARMFQSRQVEKHYLALVAGSPAWDEFTVTVPIARNPARLPHWNVHPAGADAETRLRVLARLPGQTLLEAEPVTGRTNQIRIHCAAISLPIVGDVAYGGPPADRLFLHAHTLAFPIADGTRRRVEAPVPPDSPNP
jgi:23S rRNA pseudouridine1911/1915/1917 synthase